MRNLVRARAAALPDGAGTQTAGSAYGRTHVSDGVRAKGGSPRLVATAIRGQAKEVPENVVGSARFRTIRKEDGKGHNEMTEISAGDADLEPDGTLTGEIRFHHGDEMPFTARRW